MAEDNVIPMVDEFNLAATVNQIKEFEHFLANISYVPRWKYIIVDEISGKYVIHDKRHGSMLALMEETFIYSIKLDEINLYDLETAKKLCKELNEQSEPDQDKKIQFVPILWRRYCIIHLATLYDVIQKMDAKGKTKRFFAIC